MTSIFQLASLPLDGISTPFASTSKLPNIQPRFVLPPLDDHISGTERLLGSLRGASTYDLQDLSLPPTPTKLQHITDHNAVPGAAEQLGNAEVDEDIWRRAVEEPEAGPSRPRIFKPLNTWDDIASDHDNPMKGTPFVSEKSTFTFDCLLTSLEPPINLPRLGKSSGPTPIHDSKTLLELMMRSTLGTTTTEHLKWNAKKARFIWDDEGGRPIGVERITAKSMIGQFLDIGTSIRRLEMIVDSQSRLPLTPTHHALLHALATYLTFIKQRLTSAMEENLAGSSAGWNKWIGATNDVRELGEMLCEVMCWPLTSSEALALPNRSSTLLSHLYNHLLASLSASTSPRPSSLSLALAFLFSKSVGPFLNLLRAWVGLSDSSTQDEDLDTTYQPWLDLGISRRMTHTGTREYTFSSSKLPSFIPKSDRRTLFEAGENLRLLREASDGSHPLCSGDWGMETGLVWGNESAHSASDMRSHARRVKNEVNNWRNSIRNQNKALDKLTSPAKLRSSLRRHRKERKRIPQELFSPPSPTVNSFPTGDEAPISGEGQLDTGIPELDNLWALFNQSPGTHLDPKAKQKSAQLWTPTPLEELHSFLSRHTSESLLPFDSPTLPIFISTHLLSPLLTHSKMISSSLVSLYLDDLNFLDHLDILYSYWLGGDINFLGRVSSSLFGKDNAGAGEALGLGRRARTRVRLGLDPIINSNGRTKIGEDGLGEWGIGLGVGLSERSKWPPGGSELAYALRTTLLDDNDNKLNKCKGKAWDEVGDRVSFAIKQLDEEDKGRRAKWLDPQAIEALDFLYLSYSPPQSISSLISQSLLEKYQIINNLLLRLSRCQIVLRTMYWSVLHQSESTDEPYKTGVDSGLNRPPSRNSLKKSRNRQINTLFPPKSNVERRVQVLRMKMSHLVNAFGCYLDNVIQVKWKLMRRRLERLKVRNMIIGRDESSRPSSPSSSYGIIRNEDEDEDDQYMIYNNAENPYSSDDDDDEDIIGINQLQSPNSIIIYQQIILDNILKSCLLGKSQGQQVTFKILMSLFKLILDMGKVLVEVERGLIGWEEGQERIEVIEGEWKEKERVFLHALERLSLRTSKKENKVINDQGEIEEGEQTENDLQFLLSGEKDYLDDEHMKSRSRGGGKGSSEDDLKELLIRFKFDNGIGDKEGGEMEGSVLGIQDTCITGHN